MSSVLDELLEYKKDIEKNLDVIHIIFIINKQDEEAIIKILKKLKDLKVTSKDIKVIIY